MREVIPARSPGGHPLKRCLPLALLTLALAVPVASAASKPAPWSPDRAQTLKPVSAPAVATAVDDDPDLPTGLGTPLDKAEYLRQREDFLSQRFDGATPQQIADGLAEGLRQLRRQKSLQAPFLSATSWTSIGPYPIPNGQTTTTSTAISGRVTAIVVHPTNPDLVYIGLAQGGVWRSVNGGLNWTPLFDDQATLAIGALALAPSNPEILYVGTGEPNGGADCYFGLGLYRIENASTTANVYGPFNPTPTTDLIGAKDRKSTRLNSSHSSVSRMPSFA